ncbi:MAG: hypothetical protein HPY50_14575 [Firmicutes bacterium]|nr:hypothetical protein [Bacillota bacterium]
MKKKPLESASIRARTYFLGTDSIRRVSSSGYLDRKYPDLARKIVVKVEVLFRPGQCCRLLRILTDYVYFDEDGGINHQPQELRLVNLMEDCFCGQEPKEKAKGSLVSFRYQARRVMLTGRQSQVLKERIIRDFGRSTWYSLPGNIMVNP